MNLNDLSIDDLIGPPSGQASLYEQHDVAATSALDAINTGVTVTWLMQAFRMDRQTVRKRLAACPIVRYGRGNTPVYDFRQAASYLVNPRIDIKEYIQSLRGEDLPAALQKDYWMAARSRQAYMEKARQLWRTEDVFDVLAEMFKRIKTTTQLWSEDLERKHGLTAEQRASLIGMTDELLDQLRASLIAMKGKSATRSSVKDIDGVDEL